MTHILRVDASIKGDASVSRGLTAKIVEKLQSAAPGATVTARDLSTGVPQIDGAWLGAVFADPATLDADQQAIRAQADTYLDEVRAADVLVIGLPVYNFSVPAQLKAWLDQLARRGETFVYTEAGPEGLLKGKRAIVAMSSDGVAMGSEADFASGYLRHILGFFGITDVEFVVADQMAFGPEAGLARAEAALAKLAA